MAIQSRKSSFVARVSLAILLVLLSCLAGASLQAQNSALQELAAAVAGKLIPLEHLSLTECPDGISRLRPDRVVVQYIEKKFYRWHEYDVVAANGGAGVCIVVVQPRLGPLSRQDAQILLSASETWKETVADPDRMITLPPSDPSLNLPAVTPPVSDERVNPPLQPEADVFHKLEATPGPQKKTAERSAVELLSLENTVNSDERMRVDNTQIYPFNTVCYVSFSNLGLRYRGTAFLVSPYVALTAGHNVYDAGLFSWSYDFLLAPGQYQAYPGGTVYRPYGQTYAAELHTNNAYLAGGGFAYDYGAVMFDKPFSSISTFMPVQFDATPNWINVVGYPLQVQSEFNSQTMWRSSSSVYDISDRIIRYTADTSGGNSGGPVYLDSRRVVAIHTFGEINVNGGTRLVAANQHNITEWMQWHPGGTFVDVPPSYWAYDSIEKLYQAGITQGCGNDRYCPEDLVTRAEMAVFLLRAKYTGSYQPPEPKGIFEDVPTSFWACGWIEQSYWDGITQGCNSAPLLYCPLSPVSRAEMAVLLLRAKYGGGYQPPAPMDIFTDVPADYWASPWIDEIYQEKVTTGCSAYPLKYCPEGSVTRAEMAAFVVRTFDY
ncbi:S-layer homology domain-containing protein [Desulfoferrobacter suflitae]|uniref:S-layer homology domain-containing protein n=1 Tax=Desulfoferrobacter suflitae TaxID=2865782 RepID=UPI002164BF6C|nr:S-layer homology domain-containing protein [Desulfoferrobacter suflitae]MCK8601285.1 S-layer homology domain-containing protein [Desulfoferrobacter suflitae]